MVARDLPCHRSGHARRVPPVVPHPLTHGPEQETLAGDQRRERDVHRIADVAIEPGDDEALWRHHGRRCAQALQREASGRRRDRMGWILRVRCRLRRACAGRAVHRRVQALPAKREAMVAAHHPMARVGGKNAACASSSSIGAATVIRGRRCESSGCFVATRFGTRRSLKGRYDSFTCSARKPQS
jgi:hypothetical protein